jgi:hypothetical protein
MHPAHLWSPSRFPQISHLAGLYTQMVLWLFQSIFWWSKQQNTRLRHPLQVRYLSLSTPHTLQDLISVGAGASMDASAWLLGLLCCEKIVEVFFFLFFFRFQKRS